MKSFVSIFMISILVFGCGPSKKDELPEYSVAVDEDEVKKPVKENIIPEKSEVKIFNQIWTTRNLAVKTFRNGDSILHVTSYDEWKNAGYNNIPAYCSYNNNSENSDKAGYLYNWHAVTDPRGLAPEGWHIPSAEEWRILDANLGGDTCVARKLKIKTMWPEDYWTEEEWKLYGGTNEVGFYALPAGQRAHYGAFGWWGDYTSWWSTDEFEGNKDYGTHFVLRSQKMYLEEDNGYSKGTGMSVRCVKD